MKNEEFQFKVTPVFPVTTTCYPNQPDISIPQVSLKPFMYDFPRNTVEPKVVKNIASCKSISNDKRDDNFTKTCMEYPIDTTSNLYIGMDYENFIILQQDFNSLKTLNLQYLNRLHEINNTFDDWRTKSKDSYSPLVIK